MAAVAGYFAAGLDNGPIFLTVPLVVVLAAQRARPRPLSSVLVPGLALIVAGLVVRNQVHGASGTVVFWQGCGLVALALAAGLLGWWLTDRRAGRLAQARRTATEERLRMAQDLHDGVGHGLAVISMHAAVALHVLDKGASAPGGSAGDLQARLRQSLEVIRDTGRESLDALRVQLAVISAGSGGADPPGPRRPAPGLPELDDLLARVRTGGLAVTRDLDLDPDDVPEAVGQVVYAVVQESLTNVLRHARAARAVVTLNRVGEELVVTIEDDGPGPEAAVPAPAPAAHPGSASYPGSVPPSSGMGIPGMRDRVERVGGTLESGFRDGGSGDAGPKVTGYRVRARLPLSARPSPSLPPSLPSSSSSFLSSSSDASSPGPLP